MTQERKQKPEGQEQDDNDFDAGFQLPETKKQLSELDAIIAEELRSEHEQEMEEDTKQGTGEKKKQRRPPGTICCCGAVGCYIGPMMIKDGEDV